MVHFHHTLFSVYKPIEGATHFCRIFDHNNLPPTERLMPLSAMHQRSTRCDALRDKESTSIGNLRSGIQNPKVRCTFVDTGNGRHRMVEVHHSRSKNLNWDLLDFKYIVRLEIFPFEDHWFAVSLVRIYRIRSYPGALSKMPCRVHLEIMSLHQSRHIDWESRIPECIAPCIQ